MGVYIKNMEMPKTCNDCLICCEHSMLYKAITDRRSPKCPLVPVPPHGRLGDLDDLYVHLNEWYLTNNPVFTKEEGIYIRAMLAGIADAPTIIPASEEGEG